MKLSATIWTTRPARCRRPRTARKRAVMTVRRFPVNTFGQTMILAMSVSSSSVMKTTPLAVPGICRTSTRPATVTGLILRQASLRCSALRMAPSAREALAEEAHGMLLQRQAGRRHSPPPHARRAAWTASATSGSGNSSLLICGVRSGSGRSLRRRLALPPSRQSDGVEPPRCPQRGAPVEPERAEGVRLGQPLDGEARDAGRSRRAARCWQKPLPRAATSFSSNSSSCTPEFAESRGARRSDAVAAPAPACSPSR